MRILYTAVLFFGLITYAYSFETISIENKNQNYTLNQNEDFPISEGEISELEKIVFKKTDSVLH